MTDTALIARARANGFPTHADALALADALAVALARVTEWRDEYQTARKGLDLYRDKNVQLIAERDAALARVEAAECHAEALEADNAKLKSSVVAFCGIHAARYAQDFGLPEGHLHPIHYDILEKAGARMDDFTRAARAAFTDASAEGGE